MKMLVVISLTVYMMVALIVLTQFINSCLFEYDFDFLIGFWTGMVYEYSKQNVDKIILQIKNLFNENL